MLLIGAYYWLKARVRDSHRVTTLPYNLHPSSNSLSRFPSILSQMLVIHHEKNAIELGPARDRGLGRFQPCPKEYKGDRTLKAEVVQTPPRKQEPVALSSLPCSPSPFPGHIRQLEQTPPRHSDLGKRGRRLWMRKAVRIKPASETSHPRLCISCAFPKLPPELFLTSNHQPERFFSSSSGVSLLPGLWVRADLTFHPPQLK
ncbi:uncharacterized protein BJX67DRAFT_240762 [Aspergillus lucknowensis]|uniref:Uncharacterized protein n=1 Tax=Aspergillus lucknowensis TaxID=176173 RepID=A0ABR4LGH7_9EURO